MRIIKTADDLYPHGFHNMHNKPNKCEDCGKITDNLYYTPIGICNWRCEDCQNNLIYTIGYEECEENHKDLPSLYPEIPNGCKVPRKLSFLEKIKAKIKN